MGRNKMVSRARASAGGRFPTYSKAVNSGLWALLQAGVPRPLPVPVVAADVEAAFKWLQHFVTAPTSRVIRSGYDTDSARAEKAALDELRAQLPMAQHVGELFRDLSRDDDAPPAREPIIG